MRVLALEYHDIIESDAWDGSGFPGASARSYKLSSSAFERHLDSIARAARHPTGVLVSGAVAKDSLLFTFDDGGKSALTAIAPSLERRGWRGHFFIPTDYIGTSGFLSVSDLRELRDRGHCIGTHSCSHPLRMTELSEAQLSREWRVSVDTLSDILGERVTVGSIPGGALSSRVSRSAEEAGLRFLFTSEPLPRLWNRGHCSLIGRYTMRDATQPEIAHAVTMGSRSPWMRQWMRWNALKIAKAAGGPAYLTVRRWILGDDAGPAAPPI
jgi:peptidoglycan/xylan/chitin deacetylase (PgdA/CDA1 family)